MPGISRFKQVAAEAKFNVTTEFTNLGLHSAAASGDYGLVRYALANGQPINSVLHGVLPIHVACSGGDEQVVNLLIDNGADVNAPRLPLRYTSDKNRDTSAPIVGTSGSTPLHFACANGHINIVTILLQHGAHPDRADKHGVTPEAVARENDHANCAETIRRWIEQKDQDLKNRAEYLYDGLSPSTSDTCSRRHLHVKRSIDNALSLFRTHSSTPLVLTPPPAHSSTTSPSNSPVNEYEPDTGDDAYQKTRRPSLPVRKHSTGTSSRRPRSAGNGAEGPTQQQRSLGAGRTSSKYSLRNLLRKQSQVSLVESDSQSRPSLSISPSSFDKHNRNTSLDSPLGEPAPPRFKSRFGSDAADKPLMATEIHNQLLLEDFDESPLDGSPSNSPVPPGILRGHSRSSSIGQRPTSRALRFDSNSSAPGFFSRRTSSPRRGLQLNGSSSINSLRGIDPTTRNASGRDTPESAPPTNTRFPDMQDVDVPKDGDGARPHGRLDRLGELKSECRSADQGVNSSTSSLSRGAEVSRGNDFPFSISNPPPDEEPHSATSNLKPTGTGDVRLRGHSISSVSTDVSVDNPALSSSTTSTSASVTVPTPALNNSPLPVSSEGSLTAKRNNTPIDIDISTISSHAQAEALVQRTQRSILEMDEEMPLSSAALSSGRSPLSAKLAIYGETLELERRLKKEEEDRKATEIMKSPTKSLTSPALRSSRSSSSRESGLERQFSLEGQSQRKRKSRRPHTAGDEAQQSFDRVRDIHLTLDDSGVRENQGSPSTVAIVETSPTPDPSRPSSPLVYHDAPYTAPVSTNPYATSSPDLHAQSRRSFQESTYSRVVSTALDDADSMLPKVQQRDRSQQISRANKLAKMGFSPAELPPSNPGPRPSNNKSRFGGIKNLVDSIKGKR